MDSDEVMTILECCNRDGVWGFGCDITCASESSFDG